MKIARITNDKKLLISGEFIEGDNLQTPTSLSDCLLRFDASTLGLSDGDYISEWQDISGNNLNVVQTNNNHKPTYHIVDGKPIVRFNTNKWLQREHDDRLNFANGTFFIVYKATDGRTTADWFGLIKKGEYTNNAQYQICVSNGGFLFSNGDSFAHIEGNPPYVSDMSVISWAYDGFRVNGEFISDRIVPTNMPTDLSLQAPLYIGEGWFGKKLIGDMAELIVYDRHLSDSERQEIEKYLSTKWGIDSGKFQLTPTGDIYTSELVEDFNDGFKVMKLSDNKLYVGELIENAKLEFFPTDITGLQIWLDASNVSSLTKDANNRVSQWDDLSGNGNHAIQNDVNYQGVYLEKGFTGKPSLKVDNCWMRFPRVPARTIFMVGIWEGPVDRTHPTMIADTSHTHFIGMWNDKMYELIQAGATMRDGRAWVNGVPTTTAELRKPFKPEVICVETSQNTTVNEIARERGINAWLWRGQFSEFLVYDRVLTDAERKSVEKYLSEKWGIIGSGKFQLTPTGDIYTSELVEDFNDGFKVMKLSDNKLYVGELIE